MIYVVTGRHRTGTSMMMRALADASTLVPIVDKSVEKRVRSRETAKTYDPNPHGYWIAPDGVLPHDVADDSLIKTHVRNWTHITPGTYRVVLMMRDEDEAAASLLRSFGFSDSLSILSTLGDSALRNRSDVGLIVLDYATVVSAPVAAFTRLMLDGWPIDVARAAATVDPALYRNRSR